jgi:hypothetical protein
MKFRASHRDEYFPPEQSTIVLLQTRRGGVGPFRGEKGTTWEGGFRLPMLVKWPGTIEPGSVVNDIFSFEDWLPTLLAAAGDSDIKEKLLDEGKLTTGSSGRFHTNPHDRHHINDTTVRVTNVPGALVGHQDIVAKLQSPRRGPSRSSGLPCCARA